jgi:hypothetical protein
VFLKKYLIGKSLRRFVNLIQKSKKLGQIYRFQSAKKHSERQINLLNAENIARKIDNKTAKRRSFSLSS